jgi:hypothetical protein
MLIIELMSEASRRFKGPGGSLRVLLDDVPLQAAYCLDAPDEVQDGMEWYSDPDFADISGPVPRFVEVREPANTEGQRP